MTTEAYKIPIRARMRLHNPSRIQPAREAAMLVNCVAYRQGEKAADLPVQEISEALKQSDTFVWVALKDATPEELAEMQQEFGLHELAVEIGRASCRARVCTYV